MRQHQVRVAVVGVGNCAASLVQGVHYYRGRRPGDPRARADARRLRRLPRPRHHVRRRVRRRRQEGRPRPGRGHRRQREQHHQDRRRAAAGRAGAARPHPRRAGPLLPRDDHRVGRASRSTSPRCCATAAADVLVSLPAGGQRGGRPLLRPGRDRRRGRVRQRAAGVHRLRPGVGGEVPRRRRADRRRRHQEPGRRDDHAPGAGPAVRGPRRAARPHDAAQRGREHGLPEHEGARAAGVEEGLEDPGGHLAGRPRPRPGQRAHRAVGLRRRGSTTASGPTCGWRAGRSATSR